MRSDTEKIVKLSEKYKADGKEVDLKEISSLAQKLREMVAKCDICEKGAKH